MVWTEWVTHTFLPLFFSHAPWGCFPKLFNIGRTKGDILDNKIWEREKLGREGRLEG